MFSDNQIDVPESMIKTDESDMAKFERVSELALGASPVCFYSSDFKVVLTLVNNS